MSHRVLVVDDEALNVKLLATALSNHGYEILPASRGAEALASLAHATVDRVLRGRTGTGALEAVVDARLGANRLLCMADDMLTISRLEQSQVTLRLEQFALDELLLEVQHGHLRNASARRLSLRTFVDTGLMVR